jgi:predicted transcriptional regulator
VSRKSDDGITEIAAQILAHMLRNPEVVDSLEGLTRFRLLEERVQQSLADTSRALQWLVRTGLVLEEKTSQGFRTYRLNPARISDALSFNKDSQGEDS